MQCISMVEFYDKETHRMKQFPCGKCIPCRINRSMQWTIRLEYELLTWKRKASFLTLTYDNEHLPDDQGLHKKDFQDFMKRLRYYQPQKFRYYAVGEYGEREKKYHFPGLPDGKFLHGRPHYHAIVFGLDSSSESRENVYNAWKKCSKELIINPAYNSLGTVSKDSIMYVTDYIQKKQFGGNQVTAYGLNDPPFSLCSKGLGFSAFSTQINTDEILESGFLYYNRMKFPIPRYFRDKMEYSAPRKPIQEDNVYRQYCLKAFNLTDEQIRKYDNYYQATGYNMYYSLCRSEEKHLNYIRERLKTKNNLKGGKL